MAGRVVEDGFVGVAGMGCGARVAFIFIGVLFNTLYRAVVSFGSLCMRNGVGVVEDLEVLYRCAVHLDGWYTISSVDGTEMCLLD